MSQETKWRLAPLAAVAAAVLTFGTGTQPVHAREDVPSMVKAAAVTLPKPRPLPAREVPAPVDLRVTAAPVDPEAYQRRQANCLAKAIYFEARSESVDGQFAVARVILNRTESGHYPDTICGVVYQNAHRINRCQFSFACDKLPDQPNESIAWALALGMAEALVRTEHPLLSQKLLRSTHYHADYARPYWAPQLAMTGAIGRHIFYIEER
jgi:spore germination cell wall hydrolase CwlJ-like protein